MWRNITFVPNCMALEPRSSQTGLRDEGGPGSTPPDSSDNLRKLDLLQELTPPPAESSHWTTSRVGARTPNGQKQTSWGYPSEGLHRQFPGLHGSRERHEGDSLLTVTSSPLTENAPEATPRSQRDSRGNHAAWPVITQEVHGSTS